ncbi:tRNA uracil 4-sulfurtransferase ThiI [Crassaminicella profunda]|uniref:tRNA uracil 4-sulfurtransferase ThiI n=1 Tax=Crassaminicella profunda TaxID=1286698 RepID=UPI001CA67B6D|nr:tRNA uracil 4-sulfurtransferase ThiI [Crassaminicella profunda]QZY56360.1 tRNA 4-thiouridine(8) synthase ThiI [Crassaminicella profunda]
MKRILIVRYGEIALKGLNKSYFINKLVKHIKANLSDLGELKVWHSGGLVYVDMDGYDEEEVIEKVIKVFGIVSVSPAYEMKKDMETIYAVALKHMQEIIEEDEIKTFKVESRRGDKSFPMKSPEISRMVGGYVFNHIEELKVDVHHPDLMLYVDVREKAYVYSKKIAGHGGLPLGTNGTAMVLLSGGIDSPVAAWMMAKRGMNIEAVHYHSYPFTSERAKEKVIDLARIIATYCGNIRIHCVNLLPIQKEINEKCPEDEMTILSRRFMMKIAERIAKKRECHALVTGESIGQVASQTIQGLTVTNHAVEIPVFRPLIALDKVDIMDIAKKIDTYETSILPHEDCCTVFLPKRPVTKPRVDKILQSESKLDVEALVKEAVENMEVIEVSIEE